jgi:hypothetical protein
MENRIKEQICLFADRLSTDQMKGNQLRLYFSALAYTLVQALRRLALKGTDWAQAQVDTIRLKLFKIGTIVRISVRRIVLQMSLSLSLEGHLHPCLPCPALLKPPTTPSTELPQRRSPPSGAMPTIHRPPRKPPIIGSEPPLLTNPLPHLAANLPAILQKLAQLELVRNPD